MSVYDEYRKKRMSAAEAVRIVKDGDWVDYHHALSFPPDLDRALADRIGELHDVNVRGSLELQPIQVVERDPGQVSFTYNTWHSSALERKYIDRGRAFFVPMTFRNVGSYYLRGYAPVDVAMVAVTDMDEHGDFGLGVTACCIEEILAVAKHVIVEVIPDMPHIHGIGKDRINIADVDAVVESTARLYQMPVPPVPGETEKRIASHIIPLIHDGATLQLGIGGIPEAVGNMIIESDLKDLGMQTEFMSTSMLKLYQAGKINDSRKSLFEGKGLFSIAAGPRELYDFLDHNDRILCGPMIYVNNPEVCEKNEEFVSINGCLSVDLYGQVGSESAGTRHISGSGGQLDFAIGAYASPNGKSILTLPAAFTDKEGRRHSNIKPFLMGDIVTTPRSSVHYVATEYGIVNLAGAATWQRAERLIGIAAPEFRDELVLAAEKQKIWRPSNKR